MTNIQSGNAEIDAANHRGWLIGGFLEEKFGLRYSEDVELKWGVHEAGFRREEWVTGETRTAIGILISGTFVMEFRDQTLTFEKPGDYVMWGPGVDHRSHAPSDCVWLTVRWPSIAQ